MNSNFFQKNKTKIILGLTFSVLIMSSPLNVFASELIMITKSDKMKDLVLDGKWSYTTEWKVSSLTKINSNNLEIILRTAHYEEFIYVLVDVVGDRNLEKNSDRAIICFDTKNNKTIKPDDNDFCFISVLGKNISKTIQGGSITAVNGYFKNIQNPNNLITVGSPSDENDRYSKTPHSSYEFKIPIDFIGRTDVYGFYMGVYDANSNELHSWPTNIISENSMKIPSPQQWGELISPDKSLPEFNFPFLILVPTLLGIIFLGKLKNSRMFLK